MEDYGIYVGEENTEIELDEEDLTETMLVGVSFHECTITNSMLTRMDLTGLSVTYSTFDGSSFEGSDLTGSNMDESDFIETNFKDTVLSGARFIGINMQKSIFANSEAFGMYLENLDLTDAQMYNAKFNGSRFNDVNLKDANLKGANLTGVEFTGSSNTNYEKSDFTRAILSGAKFNSSNLTGVIFNDTIFNGSLFKHSTLTDVHFKNANLTGAQFKNTFLSNVDFTNANLTGARLSGASFIPIKYENLNLTGANLSWATFDTLSLNGNDLTGADLTGTHFNNVDLTNVNFSGLDLTIVVFKNVNLTNANLSRTNLSGLDLTDSDLTGADLTDANLTGTILPTEQRVPYTIDNWLMLEQGLTTYTNVEPEHLGLISVSSAQINSESKAYDLISGEDVNVYDYLSEDINNVLFIYNRTIYLSNKDVLKRLVYSNNAIKYKCENEDVMRFNKEMPYLNCNSFSVPCGLVKLSIMKTFIENPAIRIVEIVDFDPIEKAKSTMSQSAVLANLNSEESRYFPKLSEEEKEIVEEFGDYSSASHCQAGQDAVINDILEVSMPPDLPIAPFSPETSLRSEESGFQEEPSISESFSSEEDEIERGGNRNKKNKKNARKTQKKRKMGHKRNTRR